MPGGVAQLVEYLRCPVCRGALSGASGQAVLRCAGGHSFDVARQGYVDLSGGRVTHPGDSASMVQARMMLLRGGHYRPLADAIVAAAGEYHTEGLVVDVGAGTGYYLGALLDTYPRERGLALDVAKPALRRAASAHPRLAAVRADAWRRLPVADGAASLVLDVFAPRSGPEFHRILRPDGVLIVVTPAPDHLRELVPLLTVDPDKEQRLAATLAAWFELTRRQRHTWGLSLTRTEAEALVAMGPSAWHADPVGVAASLPEPVTVTASIQLTVWRPRSFPGPTPYISAVAQVERSISSQPGDGSWNGPEKTTAHSRAQRR